MAQVRLTLHPRMLQQVLIQIGFCNLVSSSL